MKFILEEKQFERFINKIVESSSCRSLLSLRRAGIGSIFPKSAILNNPQRFRPYERQKSGIEESDLQNFLPVEDNSDPQL